MTPSTCPDLFELNYRVIHKVRDVKFLNVIEKIGSKLYNFEVDWASGGIRL